MLRAGDKKKKRRKAQEEEGRLGKVNSESGKEILGKNASETSNRGESLRARTGDQSDAAFEAKFNAAAEKTDRIVQRRRERAELNASRSLCLLGGIAAAIVVGVLAGAMGGMS